MLLFYFNNLYWCILPFVYCCSCNSRPQYVEIKCQLDATDDFYCRTYCLLSMFQAPLHPSSGARENYTSGFCLSYLVVGFQVVGMVWSWGLCVRFAGCCCRNHLYNTLELLMMGIMVPETCWANNKICNKNHLLHLVGILFPHIVLQNSYKLLCLFQFRITYPCFLFANMSWR